MCFKEVDAWGFNGMSSLAWIFEVDNFLMLSGQCARTRLDKQPAWIQTPSPNEPGDSTLTSKSQKALHGVGSVKAASCLTGHRACRC